MIIETLHECLRQLPPAMRMRSHLDGSIRTVAELLTTRDEGGMELIDQKRNYGRDTYKVIIAPGVGMVYSEVRDQPAPDVGAGWR